MSDICDRSSAEEQQYIGNLLKQRSARRQSSLTHEQVLYCEDCGELIPEQRLKAVPGTTRCVRCQENYERGINE